VHTLTDIVPLPSLFIEMVNNDNNNNNNNNNNNIIVWWPCPWWFVYFIAVEILFFLLGFCVSFGSF